MARFQAWVCLIGTWTCTVDDFALIFLGLLYLRCSALAYHYTIKLRSKYLSMRINGILCIDGGLEVSIFEMIRYLSVHSLVEFLP